MTSPYFASNLLSLSICIRNISIFFFIGEQGWWKKRYNWLHILSIYSVKPSLIIGRKRSTHFVRYLRSYYAQTHGGFESTQKRCYSILGTRNTTCSVSQSHNKNKRESKNVLSRWTIIQNKANKRFHDTIWALLFHIEFFPLLQIIKRLQTYRCSLYLNLFSTLLLTRTHISI